MTPALLFLAAILFGPERPASAPAYGIASGGQDGPAVASDGNDYVVIWPDYAQTVSSAHLSSSGEVLSRPSTVVANDAP